MGGTSEPHIIITGAMGVGKTTVGRLLAARVGLPFLDSDAILQGARAETGAVIASRDGVARLHEIELEVFLELCSRDSRAVIAPASSVVDHERGREAMRENVSVWLTARDEVIGRRQAEGDHRRPVGETERADLRQRRAPLLEEVSTITIDTSDLSPADVVATLVERLGFADPGV